MKGEKAREKYSLCVYHTHTHTHANMHLHFAQVPEAN